MRLSAPSPPSFRVSQSKKSKLESKSKSEVRPIRPTHKNLPNSSNSVQPCYDRNSDGWQKCFTNVPPRLRASQPITMLKMFLAASAATASSSTLPPGSAPTENAITVRTKSRTYPFAKSGKTSHLIRIKSPSAVDTIFTFSARQSIPQDVTRTRSHRGLKYDEQHFPIAIASTS